MEEKSLLNRITINPEICHGKPCLRNMRWTVEMILDMISSGMSFPEILKDHPELELEDIKAALTYAQTLVSGRSIKNVA